MEVGLYFGVYFTLLGPISEIETIAEGSGIRGLKYLIKQHGKGNWRKMKGIA